MKPAADLRSLGSLTLSLLLAGCGAQEGTLPTTEAAEHTDRTEAAPIEESAADVAPAPPEPPPPEPIDIEAGTRLGPIRIGMTVDELHALGLEEREIDPRSRGYGPYRVFLDDSGVRRIEATFGDVGPIRFGGAVFEPDTHIHRLRDAFGSCEWYEGGGERYRCADGTLFVQTSHTMAPARYLLAVER